MTLRPSENEVAASVRRRVNDVERSSPSYCELLGLVQVLSGDDTEVSFRVLAAWLPSE